MLGPSCWTSTWTDGWYAPRVPIGGAGMADAQGGRDGQALAMQTRTPPLAAPPRPRRQSVSRMPRLRKATGPQWDGRPPAPWHCLVLQPHLDKVGCRPLAGESAAGQGAPWTVEAEVVAMGLKYWWKTGAAPNDYEFGLAEDTFEGQ